MFFLFFLFKDTGNSLLDAACSSVIDIFIIDACKEQPDAVTLLNNDLPVP